ncbi:hypothetical protein [Pseudomonas sp. CC6-YY-74]|uniref:hypothetical protein n=1 Tax=Pseudomonas sp. CC6-YY-74 TaxID=1930532 RepID=UPI0012ABD01B|nr:hypothetical protein [Pseudomonas sp. CC6-YY-74]
MKKSPTSNELNMAIRTGKPSDRMLLQELVSAALAGKPSFPTFWNRLLDAGVTPIPSVATTGRVSGISFQYGQGLPMKGSDMGKGFSWPALAKQLNFAASQHLHLVKPFALAREPVGGELHVGFGVEVLPITTPAIGQPVLARFIAKPVDDQCTDWVWRNKPKRIAFVERPKVYLACSGHPLVHEAIAERAKQRGVKTMAVMGSEEFRKRMWFELSLREIAVAGYQPTEQEKQGLEWWIHEQTKAGGADCSADVGEPNGDAVVGVGNQAGQNATGQGGDQRGIGGSDVSSAPGYDDTGSGKPSAAERHALSDEQRNKVDTRGDARITRHDDEPPVRYHREQSPGQELSPEILPAVQARRVARMGVAALLRQGINRTYQQADWKATIEMLWELNRQFSKWAISYGHPNEEPFGQISHPDQVTKDWAQLLVLNSHSCNVRLALVSAQSWLHLVGVTAEDLACMDRYGMSPAIRFTSGGVPEAFVHVSYGCESRYVMQRLAERIQPGLNAVVSARIGSVSFPLPGFDHWEEDGTLQRCSDVGFDGDLIGAQLSEPLRAIKAELNREQGGVSVCHTEQIQVPETLLPGPLGITQKRERDTPAGPASPGG